MATRAARLKELWGRSSYFPEDEPIDYATYLDIGGRKLQSFPMGVFELGGLEKLFAYDNQFTSLPSEISKLAGLTYLSIHSTPIEELPVQITALTNLKELWIQDQSGHINIKRAPRGITNLPCWNDTAGVSGKISNAEALRKLLLFEHVKHTSSN